MAMVEYRTYKSYSGFLVRGSSPVELLRNPTHLDWVFHLLSSLEASHWGTVQNYDGAGMSAGPLHAIAVSPSNKKQGSLWELVSEIFAVAPKASAPLENYLRLCGMAVTRKGKVVYLRDAKEVPGEALRACLSGPNGFVSPQDRLSATTAVLHFHELFSDPRTYQVQTAYTTKWLLRGQRDLEFNAYAKYSEKRVLLKNVENFLSYATSDDLGHELDLAMSVYHAFSVNAPAPASDELRKAILAKTPRDFAARLIRGLGTRNYGRWKDTTDNANRYDRTRLAAARSGWDPDLVTSLMPVNL